MRASSDESFLKVLARVIERLQHERVTYALIGAWALSVWGRPRATRDLDFLVMLDEAKLARMADGFAGKGIETDKAWAKWNPMLRGVQSRFQYRGITVDLLRARNAHDRQALLRKRRKRIGKQYCWFVSPEDLIIQKLKVGRPHDFEDALTVLDRSGKILDRRYLQRWAKRIGVSKELEYVLSL
ncbi:MAG TPA: nucleotidyltransferase [Nitrospiria bacterium]|nr:nucleotidyltransferase [Nitrospiria bacterium]HUK56833.1 nucleotidyltransferase [Nitrospiria bacterium]